MDFPAFRKSFCVLTVVVVIFVTKDVSSKAVDKVINPCTKGPAYWCADPSNSRKCRIKSNICAKYNEYLCKTKNINCKSPEPIGSKPCTWGPPYWCASVENAKECGLTEAGCAQYGGIKTTTTAPLGSNPCTWGPSYWCASLDNVKECGLTETDCDKYGGIKNTAAAL